MGGRESDEERARRYAVGRRRTGPVCMTVLISSPSERDSKQRGQSGGKWRGRRERERKMMFHVSPPSVLPPSTRSLH